MKKENDESNGKNYFSGILTSLLVGLSAGFILGVLFAPKPGIETRKEIKEKSEEFIKKTRDELDRATGKTKEYIDKGKVKIAEMKSRGEEFAKESRGKISSVSRNVSSSAKKAGDKIKKAVKKGKKKAKKVEEDLS